MVWYGMVHVGEWYGVVWYGTCGLMVWYGMVWYGNGPAGQFWQMESALKFIQGFLSTCLLSE